MSTKSTRINHWILRRLLLLDRPVAPRTDAEIAAEAVRNYPWNFSVNLLDGASFWFGLNFVSASTIVPLFVSKLTDSTLLIGLIAVIAQAGWLLPQLFTAGFTETLSRKKPMVINIGFFSERLPVWFWPIAALIAPYQPTLALIIFFVSYAWHGFGAGIIAPAWQDLLARCFPVTRRGRFFGTTTFIGTGVGALGAIYAARLLEMYPFSLNFFYVFLIGAVAINMSWVFLSMTREPVQPAVQPAQTDHRFWAKLQRIIRQDNNFRRFLQARFVLALGTMGFGFVTVAAIHRLQVANSTVGYFTVALLVGQTSGNLLSGWLADRFGHKRSLEVAGLAAVVGYGLAAISPDVVWYYLIFALLGGALGATIVAGTLITMEFSAPEQRPTYVGMANTIVGIGSAVSPLAGGVLAKYSYFWLFVLSAALCLLAVIAMHKWVKDPRWGPRHTEHSYA